MDGRSSGRLNFGFSKYAAFHLIVSRWLRLYGESGRKYCYVTLGGTELRDVSSVGFIDPDLITSIWSYEKDKNRCTLANNTVTELRQTGLSIAVCEDEFWNHQRASSLPHIFFADICGVFAWSDYHIQLGKMLQNEVIREGDCLIITSHLGHNPGFKKIRDDFSGEIDVLGMDGNNSAVVRNLFRRSHPSMTIFRALALNGIQSELAIRCFGAIKYRDESPMGVYGYAVSAGRTDLSGFVEDSNTSYFDMNRGRSCAPSEF
jgi:hypothetical protein